MIKKLRCAQCDEVISECACCEKTFKRMVWCVVMIDGDGCEYNGHYCSKKCYANDGRCVHAGVWKE